MWAREPVGPPPLDLLDEIRTQWTNRDELNELQQRLGLQGAANLLVQMLLIFHAPFAAVGRRRDPELRATPGFAEINAVFFYSAFYSGMCSSLPLIVDALLIKGSEAGRAAQDHRWT